MNEHQLKLAEARHHDPFEYLGMHPSDGGVIVRAYDPVCAGVTLIEAGTFVRREMPRVGHDGFFELAIDGRADFFPYTLEKTDRAGHATTARDPYSFAPILTDFDMHLFNEGKHLEIYNKLGAHVIEWEGVSGVLFATWAPNAGRVSIVGDFNGWDGRRHPMRLRGSSGIWELFIPGLDAGVVYKFEIRFPNGDVMDKIDPYAFYFEQRPKTASIVWNLDHYDWQDEDYMTARRERDFLRAPMSIYEVHLGSWRRKPEDGDRMLTYRELAEELAAHVKGMGFTHIELLPVAEHPLDESWGYQVIGYYAPTSRFGSPDDFKFFVDTMHRHGIGVLVDWVPGHFPRDSHALSWFDGTALYEHADPRQGEHKEWGTKVFNFGRNEVRNFLAANAMFWLKQYHIDGLRVDAVASMLYLDYSRSHGEWIPNKYGGNENLDAIDFLKNLGEIIHGAFPGAMLIAEESTAWPGVSRPVYLGGLGFTMKWNMGWMHDILEFFSKDPIHRKFHHEYLTFALLYAFHENFVLPLSHDEVVHGKRAMLSKMPGDLWQQFANLRLLYSYMYAQPGKKLIFMGGEFGQWNEWYCNTSLDWHLAEYRPHWALMRFLSRLNHLHRSEPALHELDFEGHGFEWIDFRDTDNGVISFIRRGRDDADYIVCAFNTTPVPRYHYRIGVPEARFYQEIVNTDSELYWGSNLGNAGGAQAEARPWHNQSCSMEITMPPLAGVYFKPV